MGLLIVFWLLLTTLFILFGIEVLIELDWNKGVKGVIVFICIMIVLFLLKIGKYLFIGV